MGGSEAAEVERQRAGCAWACARHLFGPLLIRSPNPRFLHGPFPVGDMDQPLSSWGYGPAPACGTSGMAALMSCTSPCVFFCISHDFAFGGRYITLLMDHGTISCLMFGLIKATRPPRKMKERMRQMCVPCVVRGAPPSQLVVSATTLL